MSETTDETALLRAQLAASQEELRATREMFQLAMDSIPQCIWWKDTESRFLGCNKNLAQLAGMEVSQLLGRTDLELALGSPEEAAKYRRDDARVMETDRAEYGLVETQQRPDGRTYYLETNKVPLHNGAGEVIGILGTFEDVTERQLLEQELRRHRDQLELIVEERTGKLELEIRERELAEKQLAQRALELDEANQALRAAEKAKSQFFANVSHELRTPLTLILGPLESALGGSYGPLDPPMEGALRTVHNSGLRLLELVTSVLDMSRVEAGQLSARPTSCHVHALFETILSDFRWLAQTRGQNLRWKFSGEGSRWIDAYLFERILFNLVSNALKFTADEGNIQVVCKLDAQSLTLSVEDDGIGIASAEQQNLFCKFYQVESSNTRRYEGTGLGLAMVREFAHVLGGTVQLRSAPGAGSTFTVNVPAPLCEAPAAPSTVVRTLVPARPHTTAWVEAAEGEGPELLIAEDNEELACYLAQLLRPYGRLRWAQDGEAALNLARVHRPALILSDVMMPNRDGLWLCRKVKEEFPDEPPAVILLTAQTEREALLAGWGSGADDFLHKPFHPLELTTRVQTLLQTREARLVAAEERRHLEERLWHAEKLDSLGLMAGGIAHDFNNLLTVVTGHLELAEQLETFSKPVVECLEEASKAAWRAAELSRQMLTYVGKVPARRVPLELAPLVNETVHLVERGMIPKPIVHLGLAPATLLGDPGQVSQIVLNLVTNAVEAVPAERRAVVHVKTGVREFSADFFREEAGGCYPFLLVQDNGCGMDEELQKRIFDPFFSTKYTGRGLGLASVFGILRSHSARWRIVSQVGVGTEFWVFFEPAESTTNVTTSTPLLKWRGTGTVLLIDDEPEVRAVTSRMLELAGFEVLQAQSGAEAIRIGLHHPGTICAAIVDIILPDGDGRGLARTLQALRPGLPTLLCSGYQRDTHTSDLGECLAKPFTMTGLTQALRRLLEGEEAGGKCGSRV